MLHIAYFVLLLALLSGGASSFSQESSSNPEGLVPAVTPSDAAAIPVSEQVTAAEAAIANSDWKAAEAKLTVWLATHPGDARALFDAGYVADAQNRLDDAEGLYRRAVEVNPQSLEAHLSLGLLLARQNKPAEAHPEIGKSVV